MIETKTYRTWEERQHPDGHPPIQMKEVTAMVDEIEQLRARIRELESYNLGLANESHAQQSRIKELEAINLGLTKTLVEMEAENAELRKESKKDLQTLSKAAWYLYTGQSARQVIDFIRCRLAFKTKQKADDEGKRDD